MIKRKSPRIENVDVLNALAAGTIDIVECERLLALAPSKRHWVTRHQSRRVGEFAKLEARIRAYHASPDKAAALHELLGEYLVSERVYRVHDRVDVLGQREYAMAGACIDDQEQGAELLATERKPLPAYKFGYRQHPENPSKTNGIPIDSECRTSRMATAIASPFYTR